MLIVNAIGIKAKTFAFFLNFKILHFNRNILFFFLLFSHSGILYDFKQN